MKANLKIFKEPTRYSATNRPKPGTRLLFSPVKQMIDGLFTPDNRTLTRSYLKQNNICIVVENTKNLVLIQFPNQKDTDLVSPEFLITIELTKIGTSILGDNWKQVFDRKVS